MAYVIMFLFFGIFCFFAYHAWMYRNPWRLYLVFGPKGSGKTTLITKLAFKYNKKGYKVYSSTWVPGVYYFDPADIGNIRFDQKSVVFCDEAGILFDNRDFKNFTKEKRNFFKYQRQYRVIMYLFSQAFDVDKKIRDLTDYLYIMDTFANCISIARRIRKKPKIVPSPTDGSDTIGERLQFAPLWAWPFGGCHITWIPHWVQYFKSFDPPELPEGSFTYVEPVEVEDVLHRGIHAFERLGGSCRDRLKALPFFPESCDIQDGETGEKSF